MDHISELLKSLYIMASMVEARDPYTGGHLWRVSQFSRILASDIQLPDTDVARIALGGFLHDLGKIGVPDAILNRAGPLTDEEYAVIKTHPEVGNRLLSEHPLAALAPRRRVVSPRNAQRQWLSTAACRPGHPDRRPYRRHLRCLRRHDQQSALSARHAGSQCAVHH